MHEVIWFLIGFLWAASVWSASMIIRHRRRRRKRCTCDGVLSWLAHADPGLRQLHMGHMRSCPLWEEDGEVPR